ncbi:MAG: T9SS type A sorting domain-containing protein [Bacteroidia bacterium]|jgi:hypothetical protein|nr:T9SS type A sorting domain-containing protein [Bacteroidia bacterium]
MKKIYFLVAPLLMSGVLCAQYYQRAYGGVGAGCDVLRDGVPSVSGLNGHIIAGHTDVFAGADMTLTRTNDNGDILGATSFNNGYRMFNGATTLATDPVKVLHTTNNRILVVGNSTRLAPGNTQEIYIGAASAGGGFFSTIGYVSQGFNNAYATSACLSAYNTAEMFVTGYILAPSFIDVRPFIICYNWQTNTTIWSQTYDVDPSQVDANMPTDIICSPYNTELMIIGNHTRNTVRNGFMFKADPANGSFIPVTLWSGVTDRVVFYDNRGVDTFESITTGSSSSGGAQGFVIAGNSDFQQNYPQPLPWLLKIDPDGNVLWTNELIYRNGSAGVTDVEERLNTSGTYEYYLSGNAAIGYTSGDQDFLGFKCDDAGNVLFEFTYNNPGFQNCVAVGLVQNTATDGLALYGSDVSAMLSGFPGDLFMVKAYFDGAVACNESIFPSGSNPWFTAHWVAGGLQTGAMISFPLTITNLGPFGDYPYCSAPFIAGASNAREAATQQNTADAPLALSPNPLNKDARAFQLQTEYSETTELLIEIHAADGRIVERITHQAAAGKQQQAIGLREALATGVYLVRVYDGASIQVHRLVVE